MTGGFIGFSAVFMGNDRKRGRVLFRSAVLADNLRAGRHNLDFKRSSLVCSSPSAGKVHGNQDPTPFLNLLAAACARPSPRRCCPMNRTVERAVAELQLGSSPLPGEFFVRAALTRDNPEAVVVRPRRIWLGQGVRRRAW